jgi:hypothetical protein
MKKRIAALAGVLTIAAVAPASAAAPANPTPRSGLGTAATTPALAHVIDQVPANPPVDVNPGQGVDTVLAAPVAP